MVLNSPRMMWGLIAHLGDRRQTVLDLGVADPDFSTMIMASLLLVAEKMKNAAGPSPAAFCVFCLRHGPADSSARGSCGSAHGSQWADVRESKSTATSPARYSRPRPIHRLMTSHGRKCRRLYESAFSLSSLAADGRRPPPSPVRRCRALEPGARSGAGSSRAAARGRRTTALIRMTCDVVAGRRRAPPGPRAPRCRGCGRARRRRRRPRGAWG